MIKILYLILAVTLLAGASFLGFSIYRLKHEQRLIPVELLSERLESALNNNVIPPPLVVALSQILDKNVGNCEQVKSATNGHKLELKKIEGSQLQFFRVTHMSESGTLCNFPEFGAPTLFLSSDSESDVIFRRTFQNPLQYSFESGKMGILSDRLHVHWRAAGIRIELKSEAPVSLLFRHQGSSISISVMTGKLNVDLLRNDRGKERPIPLIFGTTETSSITSNGAEVASKRNFTTLLPSGFSAQSQTASPPPPGSNP